MIVGEMVWKNRRPGWPGAAELFSFLMTKTPVRGASSDGVIGNEIIKQ